jgi:hypothetical protein
MTFMEIIELILTFALYSKTTQEWLISRIVWKMPSQRMNILYSLKSRSLLKFVQRHKWQVQKKQKLLPQFSKKLNHRWQTKNKRKDETHDLCKLTTITTPTTLSVMKLTQLKHSMQNCSPSRSTRMCPWSHVQTQIEMLSCLTNNRKWLGWQCPRVLRSTEILDFKNQWLKVRTTQIF